MKSIPSVGFEPAIPAIELRQTYALHRTATGIGRDSQLHSLVKVRIKATENRMPKNGGEKNAGAENSSYTMFET